MFVLQSEYFFYDHGALPNVKLYVIYTLDVRDFLLLNDRDHNKHVVNIVGSTLDKYVGLTNQIKKRFKHHLAFLKKAKKLVIEGKTLNNIPEKYRKAFIIMKEAINDGKQLYWTFVDVPALDRTPKPIAHNGENCLNFFPYSFRALWEVAPGFANSITINRNPNPKSIEFYNVLRALPETQAFFKRYNVREMMSAQALNRLNIISDKIRNNQGQLINLADPGIADVDRLPPALVHQMEVEIFHPDGEDELGEYAQMIIDAGNYHVL